MTFLTRLDGPEGYEAMKQEMEETAKVVEGLITKIKRRLNEIHKCEDMRICLALEQARLTDVLDQTTPTEKRDYIASLTGVELPKPLVNQLHQYSEEENGGGAATTPWELAALAHRDPYKEIDILEHFKKPREVGKRLENTLYQLRLQMIHGLDSAIGEDATTDTVAEKARMSQKAAEYIVKTIHDLKLKDLKTKEETMIPLSVGKVLCQSRADEPIASEFYHLFLNGDQWMMEKYEGMLSLQVQEILLLALTPAVWVDLPNREKKRVQEMAYNPWTYQVLPLQLRGAEQQAEIYSTIKNREDPDNMWGKLKKIILG